MNNTNNTSDVINLLANSSHQTDKAKALALQIMADMKNYARPPKYVACLHGAGILSVPKKTPNVLIPLIQSDLDQQLERKQITPEKRLSLLISAIEIAKDVTTRKHTRIPKAIGDHWLNSDQLRPANEIRDSVGKPKGTRGDIKGPIPSTVEEAVKLGRSRYFPSPSCPKHPSAFWSVNLQMCISCIAYQKAQAAKANKPAKPAKPAPVKKQTLKKEKIIKVKAERKPRPVRISQKTEPTRLQALELGQLKYTSQFPCKLNHSSERYTSTTACVQCVADNSGKYRDPTSKPKKPALTEITTAEQAIELGLSTYYTGIACVNGHVCERTVRDKHCVECTRERSRAYMEKKRERLISTPGATSIVPSKAPCRRGHSDGRYRLSNACVTCARLTQRVNNMKLT